MANRDKGLRGGSVSARKAIATKTESETAGDSETKKL